MLRMLHENFLCVLGTILSVNVKDTALLRAIQTFLCHLEAYRVIFPGIVLKESLS